MPQASEYSYFLKELLPNAGQELLRLMHGAAENAFLLRSDFYTMRDWVAEAEERDQEALHAILLLMLVALEEGSLCIEAATPLLVKRLLDFVPDPQAAAWAARIEQCLDPEGVSKLIGISPNDHKPVILYSAGSRRFLYFQKYLRAELEFRDSFRQRLCQATATRPGAWPALIQEVLLDQPGWQPDADQQRALEIALRSNFAIISGGPGTGKTSIVLTLLRCLIRAGVNPERIALAAPTGRAAQRLTDALRSRLPSTNAAGCPDDPLRDLAASTLHHLLGYRPARNLFTRHAENPIPADVVIVDEGSMVGLVLMAQLFQALGSQTALILLGDKDQLPSVDAGAVLSTLIPSAPDAEGLLHDRVVLLRTNHRSQQQIRTTAEAINCQDAGMVDQLPVLQFSGESGPQWHNLEQQGGCWLLEQTLGTPHELRGFLQHWADQAYFRSSSSGHSLVSMVQELVLSDSTLDDSHTQARLRQLFVLLDRFRLLTLVRDGTWGCVDINAYMAQYLRPRIDGDTRVGLFPGAPVLITRNDALRGLNNGDVGITLPHAGGGLQVLFQRQDGFVAFPAEALPAHELGFALTVHKSQGSEYAHVMLVLPPTGGKRLLTKELIYTAITRAKTLAVVCATKEVLKLAISRRIIRESGLLPLEQTAKPQAVGSNSARID